MKYLVKRHSDERTWIVEANSNEQAKRIVCRWNKVQPSDYFCGLTNYSAKKQKNEAACK